MTIAWKKEEKEKGKKRRRKKGKKREKNAVINAHTET